MNSLYGNFDDAKLLGNSGGSTRRIPSKGETKATPPLPPSFSPHQISNEMYRMVASQYQYNQYMAALTNSLVPPPTKSPVSPNLLTSPTISPQQKQAAAAHASYNNYMENALRTFSHPQCSTAAQITLKSPNGSVSMTSKKTECSVSSQLTDAEEKVKNKREQEHSRKSYSLDNSADSIGSPKSYQNEADFSLSPPLSHEMPISQAMSHVLAHPLLAAHLNSSSIASSAMLNNSSSIASSSLLNNSSYQSCQSSPGGSLMTSALLNISPKELSNLHDSNVSNHSRSSHNFLHNNSSLHSPSISPCTNTGSPQSTSDTLAKSLISMSNKSYNSDLNSLDNMRNISFLEAAKNARDVMEVANHTSNNFPSSNFPLNSDKHFGSNNDYRANMHDAFNYHNERDPDKTYAEPPMPSSSSGCSDSTPSLPNGLDETSRFVRSRTNSPLQRPGSGSSEQSLASNPSRSSDLARMELSSSVDNEVAQSPPVAESSSSYHVPRPRGPRLCAFARHVPETAGSGPSLDYDNPYDKLKSTSYPDSSKSNHRPTNHGNSPLNKSLSPLKTINLSALNSSSELIDDNAESISGTRDSADNLSKHNFLANDNAGCNTNFATKEYEVLPENPPSDDNLSKNSYSKASRRMTSESSVEDSSSVKCKTPDKRVNSSKKTNVKRKRESVSSSTSHESSKRCTRRRAAISYVEDGTDPVQEMDDDLDDSTTESLGSPSPKRRGRKPKEDSTDGSDQKSDHIQSPTVSPLKKNANGSEIEDHPVIAQNISPQTETNKSGNLNGDNLPSEDSTPDKSTDDVNSSSELILTDPNNDVKKSNPIRRPRRSRKGRFGRRVNRKLKPSKSADKDSDMDENTSTTSVNGNRTESTNESSNRKHSDNDDNSVLEKKDTPPDSVRKANVGFVTVKDPSVLMERYPSKDDDNSRSSLPHEFPPVDNLLQLPSNNDCDSSDDEFYHTTAINHVQSPTSFSDLKFHDGDEETPSIAYVPRMGRSRDTSVKHVDKDRSAIEQVLMSLNKDIESLDSVTTQPNVENGHGISATFNESLSNRINENAQLSSNTNVLRLQDTVSVNQGEILPEIDNIYDLSDPLAVPQCAKTTTEKDAEHCAVETSVVSAAVNPSRSGISTPDKYYGDDLELPLGTGTMGSLSAIPDLMVGSASSLSSANEIMNRFGKAAHTNGNNNDVVQVNSSDGPNKNVSKGTKRKLSRLENVDALTGADTIQASPLPISNQLLDKSKQLSTNAALPTNRRVSNKNSVSNVQLNGKLKDEDTKVSDGNSNLQSNVNSDKHSSVLISSSNPKNNKSSRATTNLEENNRNNFDDKDDLHILNPVEVSKSKNDSVLPSCVQNYDLPPKESSKEEPLNSKHSELFDHGRNVSNVHNTVLTYASTSDNSQSKSSLPNGIPSSSQECISNPDFGGSSSENNSSIRNSRPRRQCKPPQNEEQIKEVNMLMNMDSEDSCDEDYVPVQKTKPGDFDDSSSDGADNSENSEGGSDSESSEAEKPVKKNTNIKSNFNRRSNNTKFSGEKAGSSSSSNFRDSYKAESKMTKTPPVKHVTYSQSTMEGPLIQLDANKFQETIVNDPHIPANDQSSAKKGLSIPFHVEGETKQRSSKIGFNSTLHPSYDAHSKDITWFCSICKNFSHAHDLGDLFGPLFVKDLVVTKRIYPNEQDGHAKRKRALLNRQEINEKVSKNWIYFFHYVNLRIGFLL